jgi:hypothetical protein
VASGAYSAGIGLGEICGGCASSDERALSPGGSCTQLDRIGFEKLDASTDIGFMVEKNSTETKSSAIATAVAATAIDLEFFFDGATSELQVFVNGAAVSAPVLTNLPDDEELRLTLQYLAGSAAATTCDFDQIRVIQIGR